MKKALITGVTGQDGSYLAEFLLARGYEVRGLARRRSTPTGDRLGRIAAGAGAGRFSLRVGDICDPSCLDRAVAEYSPDEVYNLAAQSHVRDSFDFPAYTAEATGTGALHILEAIRRHAPECRFYQAGSSEMFGKVSEIPQRETTPFHPRSPYAAAKVFAHHTTVNFRESYGLHASAGILFNHESPRRGVDFVTRKITMAVARIAAGLDDSLYLGNLEARRDWGYAPEYVEAMWLMLQRDRPGDYVVATGETRSVREFAEAAFAAAGLDWTRHVKYDAVYERPAEVDVLQGDPSLAERVLGWKARTKFAALVEIMVDADRELLAGRAPRAPG